MFSLASLDYTRQRTSHRHTMTTQYVRYVCNLSCRKHHRAARREATVREALVRACDCRLVTGRGDGGDGSDGCEAGDGEERADCRLSYLVFDADSAEESRRRSVAATVKEEELASGVMRARAVMATMAAPLARHRSHRRQRRAQREERVSKQRQPWARAGGGGRAAEKGVG